jgi:CRISPR-associated protein Csb2
MFALAVELLTGRYVATAYNDRERSEWPPHPARFYSALVATHFDDPQDGERGALEWLERQGPPWIAASKRSERQAYTTFVPVNDRVGEPDFRTGDLAGLRIRQPRTFPSVTPARSRVTFVWPEATAPPEVTTALDRLAARVVRLGHSSSLVAVRVATDPIEANWRPDDRGTLRLRIAGVGQLENLERRFDVHRESEPRVLPATLQLYTDQAPPAPVDVPRTVFSDDWLVLRRLAGPRLPSTSAVGVARVVRKIILRQFGTSLVPEVLSGHRADGSLSETVHVAIVPLPVVGWPHADGSIVGVAVVLPVVVDEQERRVLFNAIAEWERDQRRDAEDAPALPVHLGRAGILTVVREDDVSQLRTLRAESWSECACRWASATPIALDRNPGNLRSRDPRELGEAVNDAESIIARNCEHIGLPRPSAVTILPAAPLIGAAKAREFPPFPGVEGRFQRVLTHAAIEFAEPVRGPILLGAGRYVGLGLMRPVRDE